MHTNKLLLDSSWRIDLLNVLLLVGTLFGIALFVLTTTINPGFAGSWRGIFTIIILAAVLTATLIRGLPEILRLIVLLFALYSMGVLNIINQGPVTIGVLF